MIDDNQIDEICVGVNMPTEKKDLVYLTKQLAFLVRKKEGKIKNLIRRNKQMLSVIERAR